jgi:hypothetical protein
VARINIRRSVVKSCPGESKATRAPVIGKPSISATSALLADFRIEITFFMTTPQLSYIYIA